jgi:hypothetical protein
VVRSVGTDVQPVDVSDRTVVRHDGFADVETDSSHHRVDRIRPPFPVRSLVTSVEPTATASSSVGQFDPGLASEQCLVPREEFVRVVGSFDPVEHLEHDRRRDTCRQPVRFEFLG